MSPVKMTDKKSDEGVDNRGDEAIKTKISRKNVEQPVKSKKTESTKKAPRKPDEPRVPWWPRFQQYLREVAYEMRKVMWPSRKETIGTTAVVLVIVILSGVYLGIVDLLLSRLVRMLVG